MGNVDPVLNPRVRTDGAQPDDPATVVTLKVPPGSNGTIERFDFTSTTNVIYVGYAPRGAATSAPVWIVKEVTFDASGNPLSSLWSAQNVIWDNRTTLIYS